jgi:hypothetical protein
MRYKKILVSAALAAFPCFCLAYTWDGCLTLSKVMNNVDGKGLLKITGPMIFKSVNSDCKIEGGAVILYRTFTMHSDFESSKNFVINNYPRLLDEDFLKTFSVEYCARDSKSGKWVFRGDPIYYSVNRSNGDFFAEYRFTGNSCN